MQTTALALLTLWHPGSLTGDLVLPSTASRTYGGLTVERAFGSEVNTESAQQATGLRSHAESASLLTHHEEILDWDASTVVRPNCRTGTIQVKLSYAGRR